MMDGRIPGHVPPGLRGVALSTRPSVSVVVASTGARSMLEARLAALRPKAARHEAEIVVVRPRVWGDALALQRTHPHVRFVEIPDADLAAIRADGVAAASGDIVLLTTDEEAHVPEWLDFDVLTGPVSSAFAPGETAQASPLRDHSAVEDGRPFLSVIVPAHQAAGVLDQSLGALCASDLARDRWELIVVDDASTDETELVAAAYADVVVRLAGNPHGPAYARNRGAEVSRGEILAFVDADVTVHPEALGQLVGRLGPHARVAAVFGSYDVNPSAQSLVSQYRNLLHHFVHQRNPGPAETFWSGLGAIRASVFAELGMFDEWHYSRPQIEDIELGRRLRAHGHTVLLDPTIQGSHLKRWTFRNIIATDFQHRGVPWMWLLLQEGGTAGARPLNIGLRERLCTALVAIAVLAIGAAMVLRNYWFVWVAAAAVATTGILNLPFYRYLRRHRSFLFTLGVLPLHFSYYLTNIVAAGAGWVVYQMLGSPSPPAERQAAAQVGIATWPPAIQRPRNSTWSPRAVEDQSPARPPAP